MKTCPQCNASVSDEYRFCLNCGTVLETSAKQREEPLSTVVYQGPIVTPSGETSSESSTVRPTMPSSVPPTMPSNTLPTSTASRLRWLPWLVVAACIVAIGVLVTIIAIQKKSSATEIVATAQSPEPTPTVTTTETASNPNSNQPTPSSSVSPPEKKETPSPSPTATPTPAVASVGNQQATPSATPTPAVVIITPTPTPTPSPKPTPQSAVDSRVYSNREVTERARISSQPKPAYTDSARQNQIQGTVLLSVVLKFDGTIGSIRVASGLPYGLTEQAIAAARNIKFTPAKKDGVPVSVSVQVEYVFNVY